MDGMHVYMHVSMYICMYVCVYVCMYVCMYICMNVCMTLYCIVLYLYIYIALLAVHTNQKRFQCGRPREKRAVLRERKEALGSPVNKVDRVEGRNWFQSEGLMIAKARV